MAGPEDEWKLLCMGRGYHVYKYVWDLSQRLFNHRWKFFRGMPNFSVQWDKLSGTEQRAAFASWCTGIEYTGHSWALHHQQIHVVLPGHSPCLLASSGHGLTIFSLSVDLQGSSDIVLCTIYNTAEVVCQGRHLAIARTHHTDGSLPLQLFRLAYNGTEKIPICSGGAYIGVAPIL